ncbi:metal-dependent transcriptional regulator [Namhaeicola litoreus]|uniref:Transcriptional regulator MntR n=1 Tax=Namhaeicola litoreus TaxID=1052145 RepID=A0ABW3Y489_9FLAO
MISAAEENYLKTIYSLQRDYGSRINTNQISSKIQTKASSVTDMLKKLSAKKLVIYEKYQGVYLTEKGKKVALKVVRKHRLWEYFLVEKLKYNWDEVHSIAEQLEHIDSETLVDNLEKFLGFPKFDPHGDPIPDKNGNIIERTSNNLLELNIGDVGVLDMVKDSSETFLQYLDRIKLALGDEVEIIDKEPFDNSVRIKLRSKEIFISEAVAENIYLKKTLS